MQYPPPTLQLAVTFGGRWTPCGHGEQLAEHRGKAVDDLLIAKTSLRLVKLPQAQQSTGLISQSSV
jgi:hypothetical protein